MNKAIRFSGIERYLKAMEEIELFYGDKRAKRSQVKLINHINEGCAIISDRLHYTDDSCFNAMAAFCLHPIFQSEEVDSTTYPFVHVHDDHIVRMAKDYAEIANMYLCREDTDHIKCADDLHRHLGEALLHKAEFYDIAAMLYADKVQNRKDFDIYHWERHERSNQLERYFNIWIDYLNRWVGPDE